MTTPTRTDNEAQGAPGAAPSGGARAEDGGTQPPDFTRRRRTVTLLALSTLLAMSAWFSTGAVGPALQAARDYSGSDLTWMAIAVQAGFVVGTLTVAILNIADIFRPQRVYLAGAILASIAAISLLPDQTATPAIVSRFFIGLSLAAVYPVGMKVIAGWYQAGRGLILGVMIGALSLGSGLPHLFGSLFDPDWQPAIIGAAVATLVGGIMVGFFVTTGPFTAKAAPFRPRYAIEVFKHRPTALATSGYLGHMWELYAMWTWMPVFLLEVVGEKTILASFELSKVLTFVVFAAGAVGCVAAGFGSERFGRTRAASAAMIGSGSIAVFIGFLPGEASVLIVVLAVIWGATVVADSAQFSTAMTELANPNYIGSALALQTAVGFLLTIVSIRLVPIVENEAGWGVAFAMLAVGPALGTLAMMRLRQLPEAAAMAGGRR